MKNVLLIGGTGVLSSAMTAEAIKCGYRVTMINRGHRKAPEGVEVILADKDDKTLIAARIKGRHFDAVIDFLCYTVDQLRASFSFYSTYTQQYFFISSCAVYAPKKDGVIDEEAPKPNPVWKYSVDKWDCELELQRLSKDSHCKYTVIRPAVTYGNTRIPYGIAPRYGYHWTLVARVLAGKPIITWNGGGQRTRAMRVEDFAVGAIGLVGNEKAYNEAFNICSDESNSFQEVLDVISEYVEKPVVTCDVPSEYYAEQVPNRAGEILGGRTNKPGFNASLSNEKLKAVVPEFRQNISLQDGVRMTLDAYKNGNFQKGIDWEFDGETDRIIKAWSKENGLPASRFYTSFVDYLNSAGFVDKYRYWRAFNRDSFLTRLVMGGWRLLRRFA